MINDDSDLVARKFLRLLVDRITTTPEHPTVALRGGEGTTPSYLDVVGPVPLLNERIYAYCDRTGEWWYWWSWAERICRVIEQDEAARTITRVVMPAKDAV